MKHSALLAVLCILLGGNAYAELPYYNQKLIQERLQKFNISNEMKSKHPELVRLILTTETIGDIERQMWFDKYSEMSDEQVNKLFHILDTERKELETLEKVYEEREKKMEDEKRKVDKALNKNKI